MTPTVDDEVPGSPERRRRRRSISVPSFDDRVNEGPASETPDRVRFQNGNSPVRWRLLADGVSGKIPLIDQRAILELAFRMWSEVIPLKFHESSSIDVVNVDVIIAFAKRESLIFVAIERIFIHHIGSINTTRNTLDCDQSNYSSRIVFSYIPTAFGQAGVSAIRSADLENPTVEPNMKWIGSSDDSSRRYGHLKFSQM